MTERDDSSPSESGSANAIVAPSSAKSMLSGSLVLAASRLVGYALMLLSPIVLVRVLDVTEFGQYRQFVVVAMLLSTIAEFTIATSITYFVPREPAATATFVSNACLMLLVTSSLAAIAVLLGGGWLVPAEIADLRPTLAAYVFLFVNLEVVTSLWVAQGRADRVLIYSTAVAFVRIGTVVVAATMANSLSTVFSAMVACELVRVAALYAWLSRNRYLGARLSRAAFAEQLSFILPTGASAVLYRLNDGVSKTLVGNVLGSRSLATYTIASYQAPFLSIVKGSISDAIFPEMVRRNRADPRTSLLLWQRSTVVALVLVAPAWLLMTFYANTLITILFTPKYLQAVPYFQVLCLLMIRQCFDFSANLRSDGYTRPFIVVNGIGFLITLSVTAAMLGRVGLWAPTIGQVSAELWLLVAFGYMVMRRFALSWSDLFPWGKVARIGLAALAGWLGLLAFDLLRLPPPVALILGSAVFLLVYWAALTAIGFEEVTRINAFVARRGRALHGTPR